MKVISGLIKMLYWPICRTYARLIVGDKPADKVMSFLCGLFFWKLQGYWPQFENPRSFSEKVWNRMLFSRDPQWTMFSDKLRVQEYVARKVGSEYLIPMLWNGDNPEEIPFDELPSKFMIKVTHGCGYNIIVKDKTKLEKKLIIFQLKKWLCENFGKDKYLGIAWGYKNAKPTIIVESFLEDNGHVPLDYKFFCFAGRVKFFKIDFDRFEGHSEKFFDKELNPLDLLENGLKIYQGKIEHPENYEDMVRVAESLAGNLDFIRVDLYNVRGRIYFGELTCYPGGGVVKFTPPEYDFILGKKWKSK